MFVLVSISVASLKITQEGTNRFWRNWGAGQRPSNDSAATSFSAD